MEFFSGAGGGNDRWDRWEWATKDGVDGFFLLAVGFFGGCVRWGGVGEVTKKTSQKKNQSKKNQTATESYVRGVMLSTLIVCLLI